MAIEPRYDAGDLDTLARTLLGTCGREPWPVKVAVAHVVLNRARRGGWGGPSERFPRSASPPLDLSLP